jgi:hypothetical protein
MDLDTWGLNVLNGPAYEEPAHEYGSVQEIQIQDSLEFPTECELVELFKE